MEHEPQLIEPADGNLAYRFQEGENGHGPQFLLLHGYGGDESVMWVLMSAISPEARVIALRAPYAAQDGGYSWVPSVSTLSLSGVKDLEPAVEKLKGFVDRLERKKRLDPARLVLVGFSQGSALAFASAGVGALKPAGIASLAGFLPDGDLGGLQAVPVYWAHGIEDDRVPIERAREDVARLEVLGARTTFCQDAVGHKVGVGCMRGLRRWLESFQDEIDPAA